MTVKRKAEEVPTGVGKLAEVWFGVTEEMKTPRPVRIADAVANTHFGGTISLFVHTDCWDSGLMYVAPGGDTAVFSMEETDDGGGHFTEVVLQPRVRAAAGVDRDLAMALHEKAHHLCFIANSVNFPVSCRAEIKSEVLSVEGGQ